MRRSTAAPLRHQPQYPRNADLRRLLTGKTRCGAPTRLLGARTGGDWTKELQGASVVLFSLRANWLSYRHRTKEYFL